MLKRPNEKLSATVVHGENSYVVTKKKIPKFTLIYMGTAIMTMEGKNFQEMTHYASKAIVNSLADKKDTAELLYPLYPRTKAQVLETTKRAGLFIMEAGKKRELTEKEIDSPQVTIKNKLLYNCFEQHGTMYLFSLGSFFNHSCVSNCTYQIVDNTLYIRTIVDIEPNTELTISYYHDIPEDLKTREEFMGTKNIKCNCAACTDQKISVKAHMLKTIVSAMDAGYVCDKCSLLIIRKKLCGGCRSRTYCSVSCQTADWDSHRATCKA